jgi:hypothetical protein
LFQNSIWHVASNTQFRFSVALDEARLAQPSFQNTAKQSSVPYHLSLSSLVILNL